MSAGVTLSSELALVLVVVVLDELAEPHSGTFPVVRVDEDFTFVNDVNFTYRISRATCDAARE